MTDLRKFRAPFITPEKAWAEADRIRLEHWRSNKLPIDVEKILWELNLQLEPVASLKSDGDVDALLTGDLTTIIVDLEEYMDVRMDNRMRFSIAHELGHFVLHHDIYRNIQFNSVEDWIKFIQSIPEDQYYYVEQHAYEFAGRLLVPPDRLRKEFALAIKKAEKSGFMDWEKSGDAAREFIASSICRVFGVSSSVIEKRITREGYKILTQGKK